MKRAFRITAFLIVLSLICGIAMLIFGIRGEYKTRRETENYESATGYFTDYGVYSEGEFRAGRRKNTTYYLTYTYQVDGISYEISTDYGTGLIPEMGSTRTVLFDPADPARAELEGTSGSRVMIYGGLLFTGIPGCMILITLSAMGYIKIKKVNVTDLVLAVFMSAVGFGILYMIADSFNPIAAFSRAGLWAAIPVLFLICGVWLLIRGIFIPDYLEKMEEKNCETDK